MSFVKPYYIVDFMGNPGVDNERLRYASFETALSTAESICGQKGYKHPFVIFYYEPHLPDGIGNREVNMMYASYQEVMGEDDSEIEQELDNFHSRIQETGSLYELDKMLLDTFMDWLEKENLSLDYYKCKAQWTHTATEWEFL